MKNLIYIVALLILTASPALGGAITGEQFMEKCAAVEKVNRVPVSEAETVYATFCLGYMTGFVDHYDLMESKNNLKRRAYCLSNSRVSVTNTLLVETVLEYLKNNPRDRSLPLSQTVGLALEEAYPCVD